MADEIKTQTIKIKWGDLIGVCNCRMYTEHFQDPENYDYSEHCDAKECECSEENCPVWARWTQEAGR